MNVLAAREVRVEARAQLDQRRDAPGDMDLALVGAVTPAISFRLVLLPLPLRPMIPTVSPLSIAEGDVAKRVKGSAQACPETARAELAQRAALLEQEALADLHELDLAFARFGLQTLAPSS